LASPLHNSYPQITQISADYFVGQALRLPGTLVIRHSPLIRAIRVIRGFWFLPLVSIRPAAAGSVVVYD
jgi:hypothetical protein